MKFFGTLFGYINELLFSFFCFEGDVFDNVLLFIVLKNDFFNNVFK